MKIIKMTQSKHVADRWYADLEDGSKLQVNLALVADHSLFTGRELTDEELENLRTDAEKTDQKARALRMLGARNMSAREIKDRLMQKGAEEDQADETVEWLQKLGYINDREYAGMIVRHYAAKGYGRRKISDELYRRGIDRQLRDEMMEQIPEPDDAIDNLIMKRLKGEKPDQKELKRTTDMLMRRGFSWEEIKSALRRYEIEAEEE